MSRVLKFRGWDKSDNSGFYNHISLEEMIRCDFEIMQFTGLLDKNGAQIFEGDLFDYKGQIVIVEYVDDMFHLKSTKYKNLSPGNYRLNTIGPRLEILGNIHQQPELLKDKS